MKKAYKILLLLALLPAILIIINAFSCKEKQWQPHAGIINPYTDAQNITITASSGGTASVVLDDDIQTFWQSDAPYPSAYITRKDQNILLDKADEGNCNATTKQNLSILTDGNLDNQINIMPEKGKATAIAQFETPTSLYAISIKAQTNQNLAITATDKDGKTHQIANYLPNDSYQLRRYSTEKQNIIGIEIQSDKEFAIFEIAALAAPPMEYVTIKLPKIQQIGWIDSRHYTADQNALYGEIQLSQDGKNFNTAAKINPNAIPIVPISIDPPQNAQYIRIAQAVTNKDWAKISIWEADAYSQQGPYAEMPQPKPHPKTINEIIGVNGIWGWGNKKGSIGLDDTKGAKLYAKVASHARNYHEMDWDINDPDHIPDYEAMARGRGTETQPWLDWDMEYRQWINAGLKLEISVKFERNEIHKAQNWNNPHQAAYNYGYAMAKHFGPTAGNGLATAIEVGNEPWDYKPEFYRTILNGMAKGIKAADPQITVLPCALQAGYAQAEQSDFKNYVEGRITSEELPYFDAYNCHHYSYLTDNMGEQRGIYPEHPQSSINYIRNDIQFCRTNMPNKPIYVTEWGWDSDGAGETCTHSQCVSETAQAIYGIRGALWFMRLGVDKLMWYFYANGTGGSIIYNRSGLTGSVETDFAIKRSFRAFESLKYLVGDKRFLAVLSENLEAYAYLLGDKNGNPTDIIAWRPIDANDTKTYKVTLPLSYTPTKAYLIDGSNSNGTATQLPVQKNGKITLSLSAVPMVLHL